MCDIHGSYNRSRIRYYGNRESGIRNSRCDGDWIWDDSGRFINTYVSNNDGKMVRFADRADRTRFYRENHFADRYLATADDPAQIVAIYPNIIEHTSWGGSNPPLHLLWSPAKREWLTDQISSVTNARVTSEEMLEIDGEEINFKGYIIQLDPQHGYLPQNGVVPNPGADTRFVVEEFQEVQPGFWFPKHGTFTVNGINFEKWSVTHVELNQEYPESVFQPKFADGTMINDMISGKTYWHGGKKPQWLIDSEKSSIAAAIQPIPEVTPTEAIIAAQPAPMNWTWWLVGISILCISLGFWFQRRG